MAWRTREDKRGYQQRWARYVRLASAQAAYDAGDRSRRVINALGRASCAPWQKWCAWGHHRVVRARFRVARRNKDGLQDMCRRCQDMASRAAQHQQRRKQPSPSGQPAAGTPAVRACAHRDRVCGQLGRLGDG